MCPAGKSVWWFPASNAPALRRSKLPLSKRYLHRGDIILAVGTRRALEKYRVVIGKVSDVNLAKAPGRVISRKIVVTHKEVLGKSLDELGS